MLVKGSAARLSMAARRDRAAGVCSRGTIRVCAASIYARPVLVAASGTVPLAASTAGTAASSRVRCSSSSRPIATEDDVVRFAAVGDIVSVHFVLRDEDGKVLQSSERDLGEPLTFEVGAGDMMGNRLFQGFDEAVRGMAVGQTTVVEATGGEWKRELLFSVPRDHPEVARLEGRYKNQGGLATGLVVELSNNAMAVILEVNDAEVRLDANNMLAGKAFTIELTLAEAETAEVMAAAVAAAVAAEAEAEAQAQAGAEANGAEGQPAASA